MDQIYPDNGLVWMLQRIVLSGSGPIFKLFTSNTTPTLADTIATYTFTTDIPQQQVAGSAFTFTQVAAHIGSIQAPNVVFTNVGGSSHTVYGYVILDPTSTFLIGAARFDDAPVVMAPADTRVVTPILGDYSGLAA